MSSVNSSAPPATQQQQKRIRIQSEPVHIPPSMSIASQFSTSNSNALGAQAQEYTNSNFKNFNSNNPNTFDNQPVNAVYTNAARARIPIPQQQQPVNTNTNTNFINRLPSAPLSPFPRPPAPGPGSAAVAARYPARNTTLLPYPALGPPPANPLPPPPPTPAPGDTFDTRGAISAQRAWDGYVYGNGDFNNRADPHANLARGRNGYQANMTMGGGGDANATKQVESHSPPLPASTREEMNAKVHKWLEDQKN